MKNPIFAALIAGALSIVFVAGCGGGGGGGNGGGGDGNTLGTRTITGTVMGKPIDTSDPPRPVQGVTIKLVTQPNDIVVLATSGADGTFSLKVSSGSTIPVQFGVNITGAGSTFPAGYNQFVTYGGQTYIPDAVDVPKNVLNEVSNNLGTIEITEVKTADPPPHIPIYAIHNTVIYGRILNTNGVGLNGVQVNFGKSKVALDTTGKNGYFALNLSGESILDYYGPSDPQNFSISTTGTGVSTDSPVSYNNGFYSQTSIALPYVNLLNGEIDLGTLTVGGSRAITGRVVSQASSLGIANYYVVFGSTREIVVQTNLSGNFSIQLAAGETVRDLYPTLGPPATFGIYKLLPDPDPNAVPPFPVSVIFRGVTYLNSAITVPLDILDGNSLALGTLTVEDL